MKKPVYVGIDLGQKGAICVISKGKIIGQYKMPLMPDKKTVDVNELSKILSKYDEALGNTYIKIIGFENILRPIFRSSKATAIQMGRQFGQIESIVNLNNYKYVALLPRTWQQFMFKHSKEYKKNDKRDTKRMALESYKKIFPKDKYTFSVRQSVHDGIVDACLIAKYLEENDTNL